MSAPSRTNSMISFTSNGQNRAISNIRPPFARILRGADSSASLNSTMSVQSHVSTGIIDIQRTEVPPSYYDENEV